MISSFDIVEAWQTYDPGRWEDAPASCWSSPMCCLRLWRRACPAVAAAMPPLPPASGPLQAAPAPAPLLRGLTSAGAQSGPPGPRTLGLRPRCVPRPAVHSHHGEQAEASGDFLIEASGAHRQDGAGRKRLHHGLQLRKAAVQRVGDLQMLLAYRFVVREMCKLCCGILACTSPTWTSSSRALSRSAAARQPA